MLSLEKFIVDFSMGLAMETTNIFENLSISIVIIDFISSRYNVCFYQKKLSEKNATTPVSSTTANRKSTRDSTITLYLPYRRTKKKKTTNDCIYVYTCAIICLSFLFCVLICYCEE